MAKNKAKEARDREERAFYLENRAQKLVPIRRADFDKAFDGPILDERGRCYFSCILLPPLLDETRWSVRCRGADLWNRDWVRRFDTEAKARSVFERMNDWSTVKTLLNSGFRLE